MTRIGIVRFCLSASLVLPVSAAAESYRIEDAGGPRFFTLALDEVAVMEGARPQIRSIAARTDLADLKNHVRGLSQSRGAPVRLVLYEAGRSRDAFSRRLVTERLLVRLDEGGDIKAVAGRVGATNVRPAEYAPGYYILTIPDALEALTAVESLRQGGGVAGADPLLARQQSRRWLPNDPLFPQQWHLRNTSYVGGVDVAVTNTWGTYRGAGITVGVVDDGLQVAHPDLSANVNAAWSYDFNNFDSDPTPSFDYGGFLDDGHGSACAGLIAGRGNNSVGICGVAPEATLVGLALIAAPAADDQEAAAMLHSNQVIQVKNNSWGPEDDAQRLEGPGLLTSAALEYGAQYGRNGRGVIFVWAAGNGGNEGDNANYDGYANSMYTIAISAVSNSGQRASYSETGACIVVCAPAGGGTNGLVTTDLAGEDGYNYTGAATELADPNYTRLFAGTSAASPVGAGVVALMLQANPLLGWRDVQEILMRSARPLDLTAGAAWRTNSAGFKFSSRYGAGLITASNAVSMALTWTNLKARVTVTSQTNFSRAIPDNNDGGITNFFALNSPTLRVEHVQVTLDITHTNRGDLYIYLVSPRGHVSVLSGVHADTGDDYTNWTFMTVQSWGETSTGLWRVVVSDRQAGGTGTWTHARIAVHGVPVTPGQPPSLRPIPDQLLAVSNAASFPVMADDVDNNAITLVASNLPAGATFLVSGSTGTFTWASAQPVGVYTSWFHAADANGAVSQAVVLTVSAPGQFDFVEPFYVMDERWPEVWLDIGRSGGFGGTSLVRYATRNATALSASDYVATNGHLQFFNGGTARFLSIAGINDNAAEGPEYFQVVITNVSPGGLGNVITANVVIVDDDILTSKLYTTFPGGLPAGWSISNSPAASPAWRFDDPGGHGNLTGGTGTFAIADSDFAGEADMDTRLQTPVLDLRDCLKVDLSFHHDFYYYSGYEYGDVDVSTNGKAGPWENVWWIGGVDDRGKVYVDLTPWVAGRSNIMIRFRYWNAYYDYWWQLDNVEVRGEVDSDGDGMPDWWELQSFGTLTNTAAGDRDGDGAPNGDEYGAGTHPTNGLSRFRINSVLFGDQLQVGFQGSALRSYEISAASNLLSQDWRVLGTNFAGTAPARIPPQGSNQVYRLRANAPP